MKIAALAALAMIGAQVVAISVGALDIVVGAAGELVAGVLILWLVRPALAGVVRPRGLFVIAAVLIGATAWYVDLRIVTALQPPGNTDVLERVVEQTGLAPTLLAIAVLPAISEELMFRGLLARSLAPRSQVLAIVVSALAFSIYHVNPIQMVGTLQLGLALGVLAVRSGSVIPSAIAHFFNNAIAILLSRGHLVWLSDWIDKHEPAALAAAMFISLGGVGLALVGRA